MIKRVTWNDVYASFKQHFPNLRKEVEYWCPYDYLTIKVYLKDGRIFTYRQSDSKINFIDSKWIN